LADWLERSPELGERVSQAREQARQKALAGIKKAGENGDWRARAEFLRLSFPADYRKADTQVSVAATAQQASPVLLTTEEERQRLQAIHRHAIDQFCRLRGITVEEKTQDPGKS
jgi:hypothetical protein